MKSVKGASIQEKILSVIGRGDILFIVPPFVTTKTPILGPLILHAFAQQLGYNAHILHLNLLLASRVGFDLYESVSYGQPFRMLGERLFARSAYGLPSLGKSPDWCLKPATSVFGNHQKYPIEEFEYKYLNFADFELETSFHIEELCKAFLEEVIQTIGSLHYSIIGCSTNWEQNNCCVALLNGIKRLCPETVTLIGGSNCEGEMAEGIASLSESIDYIFSGESETAFTDFLKSYASGKLPSQRVIVGKPLDDLNRIPLLDYESYMHQRTCFFGEEDLTEWHIGYETSRGCWWGECYFCGMNGKRGRFRQKAVQKVIRELDRMSACYPNRRVLVIDKVMPPSYQKELLPLLEKESFSPIAYEQRSNLALHELIRLKKANIDIISPGIEGFSTGLLQLMNKGVTARQNILLLRNAAATGIYVNWNLLWGFPGDLAEQYEETLNILPLLRHCCPPAVFRHICIDRFSPYFEKPQDFRIDNLRPWAVYTLVYPEWAEVHKLAYRFVGDYPCAAHDHPELIRKIADEVTVWKRLWKTASLTMLPYGKYYMIYDKRSIEERNKTHVVEYNQAKEIMTSCVWKESENLNWALKEKLGVVVDNCYVPLVTASPELLLEFEKKREDGVME